jgi:glutathione-independent formaldehyde dehydrogenase
MIESVRFTGGTGSVGAFLPAGPGAPNEDAKQGKIALDYGMHWFKGQTLGNVQASVKKYNCHLRELIAAGKAKPSWIISHEISLHEAADAYKNFDHRTNGWTNQSSHQAMIDRA